MTQSTARASGADTTKAAAANPAEKKSFFVVVLIPHWYQQKRVHGTAEVVQSLCLTGHFWMQVHRQGARHLWTSSAPYKEFHITFISGAWHL